MFIFFKVLLEYSLEKSEFKKEKVKKLKVKKKRK